MENNSINYLGFEEETPVEVLTDYLENVANSQMCSIWNDFCDRTNAPENLINHMGQFDELFYGLEPSKIAEIVTDNQDFSIYDNYFRDTMYGLESSDDVLDLIDTSLEEIAEDILDYPNSYYDQELKKFLEEEIYSQWQFERK